jgi:AAA ATPase domain
LQSLAEPDSVFLSEATHRLVRGLVDTSFAGERTIKGKSEPQKVYRLQAIRQGVSRFEAAVSRGLATFVGREHELEVLERSLGEARSELRLVDLVAEPGMGKSRLLHEFRQRIGSGRAFVLSGSCSPDGQQTPFLPFIEVIRGSFRISAGEAERDIVQEADGHYVGRAQMILGLLYKTKKKPALAVQHLTEAKRILSQFGQTPILARVETALAELGQ